MAGRKNRELASVGVLVVFAALLFWGWFLKVDDLDKIKMECGKWASGDVLISASLARSEGWLYSLTRSFSPGLTQGPIIAWVQLRDSLDPR
jgi:hypothetical protein